ncbi:MAG TPA: RsiV family protein [Xanthobacteraceae bacterium]|jgi:hypothetical protein|nr:RsiV family protein [Xanthobacteraceae bacterium]
MTDFIARRDVLIGVAVISAWHGLCLQALAAKSEAQKLKMSVENSFAKISLAVDEALKPFAELLTNCLSEGKAWVAKKARDAAIEWREHPKAFRGLQWSYDRDYVLRSVVGHYISVVRSDDWFDGGAHPNHHVDTILWNNAAQKRTNIRAFFTETTENGPAMVTMTQLAKLAVAAAKLTKGINGYGDDDGPPVDQMTPEQELQRDTFINDGIKPTILGVGPVTLAPSTETDKSSGLTFHYSPYGVGPYVEGPYTVFVPWTKFQQYLSPEGVAIFSGERPKSDEETW